MTLLHYGSRPYEVAASDASKRAKEKLEEMIEIGRVSGKRIIEKVLTEVPKDQIVKGKALQFHADEDRHHLVMKHPAGQLDTHKHARQQICSRMNFPWKFAQHLQDPEREHWGLPLFAHNLNELYARSSGRYLVRSYDGITRGFLSDRYRRLDSRPLVEAFAGAAQKIGAIPVEGYASDTRVALKALLPRVFEPAPNEVIAFGAMWQNSDYGNGAHEIRFFVLRLWCTNYAIADDSLRQVHLGKRLSDNITFSQRTYELDTRTTASAIRDVMKGALSAERTTQYCEIVKEAHDSKVSSRELMMRLKSLSKKGLTKSEVGEVTDAFNSPDVENLPPGNTMWRLSNAISWVAGQKDDPERKVDLMKVAAGVLPKAA